MVLRDNVVAAAARRGSFAATTAAGASSAAVNVHQGKALSARPTPDEAFRAAREMFLRGQRVDMRVLAAKIGVSRTTLYRWTGNRDQLLARILWSRHKEISAGLAIQTDLRGKELIAARVEAYMRRIATSRALRQWIQREPDTAFRVLFRGSPDLGNQERAVEDLARLIQREHRRRTYKPRLNPNTLAYAIGRIIESCVYRDIMIGMEPNLERASEVVRALL